VVDKDRNGSSAVFLLHEFMSQRYEDRAKAIVLDSPILTSRSIALDAYSVTKIPAHPPPLRARNDLKAVRLKITSYWWYLLSHPCFLTHDPCIT